MNVHILTTPEELERYDSWILKHPQGNLWQSLERKRYLEALGKEVRIYGAEDGAQIHTSALVMIDRTSGGYSTWDIARGPLGKDCEKLLALIIEDAKKEKCLALYISGFQDFRISGFQKSPRHIHCEATRIIDLKKTEEEILGQMKQKGRYNIKIATKHGVTVKESKDVDAFYELVTKTGKRDGFTHLSKEKYRAFLSSLPGSFLLIAYDKQTEPIAGVLSVVWNQRGIYYYGASNHAKRAKMAPYLLQLESMCYCKAKGCSEYDLLGIAPENAGADHPWAGISGFKEKFGGEVVQYPAEQMMILKPMMYRLLEMKRRVIG